MSHRRDRRPTATAAAGTATHSKGSKTKPAQVERDETQKKPVGALWLRQLGSFIQSPMNYLRSGSKPVAAAQENAKSATDDDMTDDGGDLTGSDGDDSDGGSSFGVGSIRSRGSSTPASSASARGTSHSHSHPQPHSQATFQLVQPTTGKGKKRPRTEIASEEAPPPKSPVVTPKLTSSASSSPAAAPAKRPQPRSKGGKTPQLTPRTNGLDAPSDIISPILTSSARSSPTATPASRKSIPTALNLKGVAAASSTSASKKGTRHTPTTTPILTPTAGLAATTFGQDNFFKYSTPATHANDAPAAAAAGGSRSLLNGKTFSSASSASASRASSSGAASSKVNGSYLPPHPLYSSQVLSTYYQGRTGASSAAANHTPRKRTSFEDKSTAHTVTPTQQQHHNASYHSAALGTPLVHTHHYSHTSTQLPAYVHFRQRFRSKASQTALRIKAEKKSRNLQSQFGQATIAQSKKLLAAAAASNTNTSTNTNTLSTNTNPNDHPTPSRGKKRDHASLSSAQPVSYKSLSASYLAAHSCSRPVGGDWLWESLQHRGPFAHIEPNHTITKGDDGGDSDSDSDEECTPKTRPNLPTPTLLSPFAAPMVIHQSSIAPFLQFQDCDEENLRLYSTLRAFVRYHRVRGLVPIGSKKSSHSKARLNNHNNNGVSSSPPSSSSSTSHDFILDALYEIEQQRLENHHNVADELDVIEEDQDTEMTTTTIRNNSSRASRASPSFSHSHSSHMVHHDSSSPTPFARLVRDTSLIPTSLNMPAHVLNETLPNLFVIPISTQLMLTKFQTHLPNYFHEVVKVKTKSTIVFQMMPTTIKPRITASISPIQPGEEEWLEFNANQLPESHRSIVKLFYAHVKLPLKEANAIINSASSNSASSSSSSSSSGPVPIPLLDVPYHFNLTAFVSALLHFLYQREDCHKFVLPVDPLSDRLASYHRHIVKNPLSLHDLDMRLVCGYYDSLLEVLDDLYHVFTNTLMFHPKPFHRRMNETKSEASDRASEETSLKRDMVEQIEKVWKEIMKFIGRYYVVFMTYQPVQGAIPSTRTTHAVAHATVAELNLWMKEVASREVQTLQLLWIARRELTSDTYWPNSLVKNPSVAEWKIYHPTHSSPAHGVSPSPSAASADETDHDSDSESNTQPRKKAKGASNTAWARRKARFKNADIDSPLRPTRAHPISGTSREFELDPHSSYPPAHHSRSEAGRHARNLPKAIVRKLGRRAGKVPYGWHARWFCFAKLQ